MIPSAMASSIMEAGFVLLTAISVTSLRLLPALSQAACILFSTLSRFSLIMITLHV